MWIQKDSKLSTNENFKCIPEGSFNSDSCMVRDNEWREQIMQEWHGSKKWQVGRRSTRTWEVYKISVFERANSDNAFWVYHLTLVQQHYHHRQCRLWWGKHEIFLSVLQRIFFLTVTKMYLILGSRPVSLSLYGMAREHWSSRGFLSSYLFPRNWNRHSCLTSSENGYDGNGAYWSTSNKDIDTPPT